MFTKEQFLSFSPNIGLYIPGILLASTKYEINTPLRMCHFLAQISHESGEFKKTHEGLNYSQPDRIALIFKKYYDLDHNGIIDATELAFAQTFVNQPAKLANRVYSDRLGNGNEKSGDGFKFCGRGLIQLTGRDNYTAYSKYQYGNSTAIDKPELLEGNPDAVLSAAWYWAILRGINKFADKDDHLTVTKLVNGGTIGLDARKIELDKAKKVFGIK